MDSRSKISPAQNIIHFSLTKIIVMMKTTLSFLILSIVSFQLTLGFSPYRFDVKGGNIDSSLPMSASAVSNEEVKVGDKLPSITLQEGQPNYERPVDVDLLELIAGKKVAIFAVPGAFTPGCSKSHLPSFMEAKKDLSEKGIDMIICVATNDAYVMEAWGETSGGKEAGIKFLSDSKAELARGLGLAIESDTFVRCKRFTLIADDGVVTHYFSSANQSSDTWAPNVLSSL